MRTKVTGLAGVIVMVALGLAFAGAPMAQTTTAVNVRNFEVISVDGNKLVVRDEKGAQEITVPAEFRFTVDGKQLSASELKPGMKGTATITTTTTVRPLIVTEEREAVVVKVTNQWLIVRGANGVRRYSYSEMDKKGIQVLKDGKPVQMADLKVGDVLTAVIITEGPPVVLTEQEVQATLDTSKAPPAATPAAPTAGAAPAAAPAASPQPGAAPPAMPPAQTSSGLGSTWYVLIAILIALALFFFLRRKKGP